MRDAVTSCIRFLLAQLKSHFSLVDTRTLVEGFAPSISDDEANRLFEAMKEDAKIVAEHVHLPGDVAE
uniref:Uncharacterized protein n=1 Tax=Arundo donax TaxID=35708 RepID=A0A0A9AJR5_ARUDO